MGQLQFPDVVGDIRVDLHHALDGSLLLRTNGNIGRDEIPVADYPFEGAEAIAEGHFAGGLTGLGGKKSGILALVFADLRRIGGKYGQSTEVVDLDLDDGQTRQLAPHGFVDEGYFRTPWQFPPGDGRCTAHIVGKVGPEGIGKNLRDGFVVA